jgi:hypothetical protein
MRRALAVVAAAGLGGALLVLLTRPAGAAGGGPGGQAPPSTNGGSITVRVDVHLTGDLKGGASSGTVSAPPTCWWESTGMDAQQFLDYWDADAAANHDHSYAFWGMPSREDAEAALKKQQAGTKIAWYGFKCRKDLSFEEWTKLNKNPNIGFFNAPAIFMAIEPGQAPPPAAVDVADLRDIAQANMRLLQPVVTRSPKAGQPTIVHLPTWFWVTGDDVKTKLVRAEVDGVWAEVRADSTSVEFASAAASPSAVECADAGALVAYRGGMSEDASSCTLTFPNSTGSTGQDTVTATNTWFADWHSSEDGAFQPVPVQPAPQVTTLQLAVAETQVVGN